MAKVSASGDIWGPLDAASCPPVSAVAVVVGCTESTNSIVLRTPLGRSGIRDSTRETGARSHGSNLSGLTSETRAGIRTYAAVLGIVSS